MKYILLNFVILLLLIPKLVMANQTCQLPTGPYTTDCEKCGFFVLPNGNCRFSCECSRPDSNLVDVPQYEMEPGTQLNLCRNGSQFYDC